MDIIELKFAWDLLQKDIIIKDKVKEDRIETSIYGKSKSEISKIKRGLHLKFIVATLSILIAIGLALTSIKSPSKNPLNHIFEPYESAIFFLTMAISISVMVYFNYKAYSQIKTVQNSNLNLKDSLKNFIHAMKKTISFNIFSDTLMTPIVFAWVYYAYAFKNHQIALDLRTASLFILPVLIGMLSYYFQRFMQRLKFEKYLNRLEDYLKSL